MEKHCEPLLFFRDSVGEADSACGTDQPTEMAADTLRAHNAGPTRGVIEKDGLMAAVAARYLATPATHTLFVVYFRIDKGLAVQVGRLHKRRQLFSHQVGHARHSPLGHIVLKAQHEVVNDAISILHHSRAYLHIVAAQLDEFKRVPPRLDTTYAAQFHRFAVGAPDGGVLGHIQWV